MYLQRFVFREYGITQPFPAALAGTPPNSRPHSVAVQNVPCVESHLRANRCPNSSVVPGLYIPSFGRSFVPTLLVGFGDKNEKENGIVSKYFQRLGNRNSWNCNWIQPFCHHRWRGGVTICSTSHGIYGILTCIGRLELQLVVTLWTSDFRREMHRNVERPVGYWSSVDDKLPKVISMKISVCSPFSTWVWVETQVDYKDAKRFQKHPKNCHWSNQLRGTWVWATSAAACPQQVGACRPSKKLGALVKTTEGSVSLSWASNHLRLGRRKNSSDLVTTWNMKVGFLGPRPHHHISGAAACALELVTGAARNGICVCLKKRWQSQSHWEILQQMNHYNSSTSMN